MKLLSTLSFLSLAVVASAFDISGNVTISGNVKLDNSGTADYPFPTSLSLDQPVVRVFQRQTLTNGAIPVSGYALGFQDVQGKFGTNPWATVAIKVNGYFSGHISNCVPGEGQIILRLSRYTNYTASSTATNIGLGDVFLCMGQSNDSGRGGNNQNYTSPNGLHAWLFGNDYTWKNLADPTDSGSGQVDMVSFDGTDAAGSIWPLVASMILTNQNCPVAFIPCAKTSTSLQQWMPGVNHFDRTTLYGSAAYRGSLQPNGLLCVPWIQGEANSGDTTYLTNFTLFSSNLWVDVGCKIIPALLPTNSSMTYQSVAAVDYINQQFRDAAVTNSTVVGTPADMTQVILGSDGTHIYSDSALQAAATAMFNAIRTTFY